eukprot:m.256350 g.256350  ORF g.256350 m.256350 type:complete len:455 (-) comp34305_c0_seq1:318-1682(-)
MSRAQNLKPMKIHDKWYDMSGFDHPGGPIMMKLGESRNATALFESHHPFTPRKYLETLLAKHEVDSTKVECTLLDKRDMLEEFEWPEYESKDPSSLAEEAPVSPFALELRKRVGEYLKGEAKRRGVPLLEASKATPTRWVLLFFLASLFVATLPSFVAGEWWTLLATPFTYWICGVNVFHDGSHFALSRNWIVNHIGTYYGWWFSSPLVWYHQHVIGHHAYPNIPLRDPDLYHNGTFERHTKTLRHRNMHRHQMYTWAPIWLIGTFAMNFLKPVQMFMSGMYNRSVALVQYPRWRIRQHYVGRVLVFCLCHVWPFFLFSLGKAFAFSLVPVSLVSLCFMISSQVNHLTNENIDTRDSDFYKHQILTSHSFGDNSTLSGWATFLFTGGLNLQIEHHLFPCINHCHHPYIQPIVKQVCKKHGVFYHESSGLGEAMQKYFKHMTHLSIPEEERTKTH